MSDGMPQLPASTAPTFNFTLAPGQSLIEPAPAPPIAPAPLIPKPTRDERTVASTRLQVIKWGWGLPALLAGVAVCAWTMRCAMSWFHGEEAAGAAIAALVFTGALVSGRLVLVYLGERREELVAPVRLMWQGAILVAALAAGASIWLSHAGLPQSLASKRAELADIYRNDYNGPRGMTSHSYVRKMGERAERAVELQRDIDDARFGRKPVYSEAQAIALQIGASIGASGVYALLILFAASGLVTALETSAALVEPKPIYAPAILEPMSIGAPALIGRAERPLFVMADDVVEQPLAWLWPNVVEEGEYTVVGGLPGAGKSTIVTDIAAIVSSGGRWPDGSPAKPGAAILFELEDRRDSVTKPRLRAAGANMRHIAFGERLDLSRDIAQLDAMADHMARMPGMPPLRLVSISPMTRFFGDKIVTDDNAVRGLLEPLLDFAARRQVAVIGIAHLKPSGPREEFAGSKAFARASRANWSAVINDADPVPDEKKKQRIFYPAKVSHAPEEELYYRMKTVQMPGGLTAARVVWETESAGKWSPTAGGRASRKRMNGDAKLH